MPKQLNVNLAFTADTAKASQGIKSLQQQLTQLVNSASLNSSSLGLTKEIREATAAAAQLKVQLSSAMNANGTLDLTKFNDSLKASGTTLEQYRLKLSALGPEGTQAFSALASQISSAEIPLRRANTLLQEMGTTLMNTARWQLSSSLLHGFIGGLQHAYGYAQDLNQSLNNIRIVTGQSTEQMAQLAQKANQAAKELSTRTTDYTNASLIYYQQGLDDKAVEARTRTTLKLANVTRQSAEEVSNQMTAIWNNFDDGTKSLEYYADAITALGAKTASSSSEIAEGLSKFASVADTIGLSYETATAALATVVAETRQSADTVGTAFKTLFSRIQSINLGETLEDGVGLSKYTAAIEKAGVDVLDMNGKLREADDILTDLGHRWEEIDNTQRTAIAQTVAGQRQYSQFMALMENWDKVEQNIGIAEGSEGTLEEQAKIYEESWEAASKRVQASAEAIYQSLIDDKFFIGFNDLISGVLDRINDLIKGLGGIPGVLTTIGALLTKVFSTQIASNIDRITNNLTKASIKGAQQQQQEAITALQKQASVAQASGSIQGQAQAEGLKAQATLQETLIANQGRYNEEQLKTAQELLDQNAHLRDNVNEQAKILEQSEQQAKILERSLLSEVQRKANGQNLIDPANVENQLNQIKTMTYNVTELENEYITFQGLLKDSNPESFDLMIEKGEELKLRFQEIYDSVGLNDDAIREFDNALIDFISTGQGVENVTKAFDKIITELSMMNSNNIDALRDQLTGIFGSSEQAQAAISRLIEAYQKGGTSSQEFKNALEALRNSTDGTVDSLNNAKTAALTFGQQVQAVASFAMSFASVINSIKSAIDVLNNEDLSFGEKMLKIIPALLMSFGMLTSAMSGQTGAALVAAASHIPLIGAYVSETAAATGASAATATFGAVLQSVFPVIGLIVGGIAAIGIALKAWDNTHYSFAEKMEDAKASTERAAEAAENAKNKYEEIASAVDEYEAVLTTLNDCTAGTDEWREALEKVQEVTNNLIDQYPELLDYYDSATGKFNLEEVKEYLELLDQQKLAAEFQNYYQPSTVARITKEESEAKLATEREHIKEEFAQTYGNNSSTFQFGSDSFTNKLAGITNQQYMALNGDSYQYLDLDAQNFEGYLSSIIDDAEKLGWTSENFNEELLELLKNAEQNEDGTNVYASIREAIIKQIKSTFNSGAIRDANDQEVNFEEDSEEFQTLLDSYLQNVLGLFSDYTSSLEQVEKDLADYEGNISTAINRIINRRLSTMKEEGVLQETTKALAEKQLRDAIEYQSIYEGNHAEDLADEYKGNMDVTGGINSPSIRAQDSYYMKGASGDNENKGSTEWQDLLTGRYSEIKGGDVTWTGKVQGTDENRSYEFKDSEGNKEFIPVEDIASAITLFENGITNFSDLLKSAGEEANRIFGTELSEDINNALGKGLSEDGKFSFSNVSTSNLKSTFGEELNPQKFVDNILAAFTGDTVEDQKKNLEKSLGVSYDQLLSGIEEGLKEYQDGVNDLAKDFKTSEGQTAVNNLLSSIESTTLEEKNQIMDQLYAIWANGGENKDQMAADLATLYENAGDNFEDLLSMDFSSFDEFKNTVEEIAPSADLTDESLENLYNTLNHLGAENVSESVSERIAGINKVTSKLSKGDTIDAEDYEMLGSDITEGYFSVMADGTYRLTKSAEEFDKAVKEVERADLLANISQRQTENERLEQSKEQLGDYESGADWANASTSNVEGGEKYWSGEDYTAGSQNTEIIRNQIEWLKQLGVIGDEVYTKLSEDLEENGKLSVTNAEGEQGNLELLHDLMMQYIGDYESIEEKQKKNNEENNEDVQKLLSTMSNVSELTKYYNSLSEEEQNALGDLESLVTIFKDNDYFNPSSISTIEDYKEAIKGVGDEAGLTAEQAKEAWKNMDLSFLEMSDLSFIKEEFAAGRMEVEEFEKSINVLTGKASSFSELHELLDFATAEDYSSALQRVLNQSGTGTKEALDEIDKAILEGKADAELLGTILDRIMGASDLTSSEKMEQLDERQYSKQKVVRGGIEREESVQNYDDKEKGFKQIELAKDADDLFDPQRLEIYEQGIKNIGDTSQLTAAEVRQIGEAAISIYKDSDFYSTEQKIQKIGEAFKIADGNIDPANLKLYADTVKDLILNGNENWTLDKKLEAVKEQLTDLDVPMEYVEQELIDIIANDSEATTQEKIKKINEIIEEGSGNTALYLDEILQILQADSYNSQSAIDNLNQMLANGLINAEQYLLLLNQIMDANPGSETPQEQLEALEGNKENIVNAGAQQYLDDNNIDSTGLIEHDDAEAAKAAGEQAYIDQAQNIVNNLDTDSFETPQEYIDFFNALPEGVEYTDKLKQSFEGIKDQVTNLDDLEKLQAFLEQNGQSELANSDELFNSAFDADVKDLGFDPEQVRDYADVIKKDLVKNLQELAESEGELSDEAQDLLANEKQLERQALLQARAEQRIAQGTQDLVKGMKDWGSVLSKANNELEETGEITTDTQKDLTKFNKEIGNTMKNLLNMSKQDYEMLPEDFAAKNLDLLNQVAEGVPGAYEQLVDAARDAIVDNFDINSFGQEMQDAIANGMSFDDVLANAQGQMDELSGIIDGFEENLDPIELEAQLNSDDFLAQCNNMIQQAGLTSDSVQAYFKAMGYDVEITEDPEEIKDLSTTKDQYYYVPATYSQGATLKEGGGEKGTPGDFYQIQKVSDGQWVQASTESNEQYAKPGAFAIKSITPSGAGAGGGVSRKNSGGGGGGGGCFVAGTLVSTNNGYKKIEDIKIGDIVLSYNEQTQENEYSEVLQTFIHDITGNIYTLYIENEKIEATGIHRFLIIKNNVGNWIPASELKPNDLVLFADGTLHKIQRIDVKEKSLIVYNFEVSNNHNYYIGINKILVHNKGGCFVAGTPVMMRGYYKNIEDVQVGDIVLSYNEKLKKNQYSEVLQTMIHIVNENIYTLYIEDEKLIVTGIHRFLITRNGIQGWIQASDLLVGDLVLFADGTLHQIEKIDVEVELKTVYNFEVSGNHNYYVGKNQILAHNKGRSGGRGGARNRTTVVRQTGKAEHIKTEDRYHELNKTLERLNKSYGDIGKLKDLAFGGKHIKALEREIELQKELNKTNQTYLDEIRKYKTQDWNKLAGIANTTIQYQSTSSKFGTKKNKKGKRVTDKNKIVSTENSQEEAINFADYGINVKRNEFGQITNIDDVNKAIDKLYNDEADKYAKDYKQNIKNPDLNKLKANDAAQNRWNKIQAIVDAAREAVNQYEEDVTLEMDKITEILEGKIREQELRLEKAQYVVEIRAEIDENSLNVINFALDMMGDKARTATSRIAKLGESLKVLTKDYSSGTSDRIAGIQEVLDGIATKANEGTFTDNDKKVWRFNKEDFTESQSIGQAKNAAGETTLQQMMKYGKDATDAISSIANSGIISSDQIEWMVKESQEELENVRKVKEVRQQIFEIMQNTWAEYSEGFDKILAKQEHYMTLTKGFQNVVDLVGRNNFGFKDDGEDVEADKRRTARQKSRDLEASIDENLKKQANNRIKAYRLEQAEITKILEKNETQRKKVKDAMDAKEKAGTLTDQAKEEYMQELDAYDAIIESMTDKLNEAAQNEQAAFEEALQTNLDTYGREMERAADAFQETMAKGAYSIDLLAESMDRYIKTHSTLVPEYEKIHQLRLMDLEAEKAINQATDPKIKRELLAIQDEITAATSKDAKMSEYELTYLRQKLELKQAEAALEDAQKAKTQVSLTRDNEGNFGYVYTADDSNVADAEKNYSDKIYEMQKANAEYIQDLQNQLVTAEQEYYQKMQEISTNMALSPEARKAQMASIDADYNTLHEALTNQLAMALTAGNDIYGQYSDQYAEITGDITAQNLEHVGSFEETLLSIKTGFASWDEYTATWKSSHETYFGEAVSVLDNFASVNETTFQAAGTTMKEFSEGADEQLKSYTTSTGEAVESTDELKSAIEQLGEEAASQFDGMLQKLSEIEEPFLGYLGSMEEAAQNLADALVEVQEQMMEVQALEQEAAAAPRQTRRDNRRTRKTTPQKKEKKDIGKKNRRTGRYTRNTLVVKQSNLRRALRKLDARKSKAALNRKEERRALSDYKRANRIKRGARLTQRQKDAAYKKAAKTKVKDLLNSYKKVVVHYDTGGYTGEWSGNEGRLAVLHSKELILNQSDTQNLLSAVNMIRGISERIDLNALAQSGALSNGFSSGINGVSSGTLEQDVHITAEFPNATDRNEITEAFNNIIGLAAQYANK